MKVVLGALVALAPLVAWPCSGSFPDEWSSPANGATNVPRNLAAFLVGGCWVGNPGDGGVHLTRLSSDAGVAISERRLMADRTEFPSAWTEVQTAESFGEGEVVRLDHDRGCSGVAKSVSWTFGAEVSVPDQLSGLSVSPPRRGQVDVADGASCVTLINAAWVTIDLSPGALDARWEPYVEKTLRIDGVVWARKAPGLPEQTTYGVLRRSVTRVHAGCGASKDGLAEGEHVAELTVSFPGTNRTLVASAPFRLRCDAPAGNATPLRPLPEWQTMPQGCGCSSGEAGVLALVLVGWRRRVRRA